MKVLIIGLGSIAEKHIKSISGLGQNWEIYALRSGKGARDVENIKSLFTYEEGWAIQPDFIIISNPTVCHLEAIQSTIGWDIPLFIEKPILHSLENEAFFVKEFKNKKLLTYVACNLRFLDCIQHLSRELKSQQKLKDLNEVNVYVGSFLPAWRPGIDFRKNYSAQKEMGGGIHLDCIHEIDYIYWLFGKPVDVKSLFRSQSTLDIDAIDYANYQLIYPKFVVNITMNYYRREYKRTAEFLFEHETWVVNLAENKITTPTGKVIFESKQTILDTYLVQMEYFVSLIENNSQESFNSINDGVEVLKICLNE